MSGKPVAKMNNAEIKAARLELTKSQNATKLKIIAELRKIKGSENSVFVDTINGFLPEYATYLNRLLALDAQFQKNDNDYLNGEITKYADALGQTEELNEHYLAQLQQLREEYDAYQLKAKAISSQSIKDLQDVIDVPEYQSGLSSRDPRRPNERERNYTFEFDEPDSKSYTILDDDKKVIRKGKMLGGGTRRQNRKRRDRKSRR